MAVTLCRWRTCLIVRELEEEVDALVAGQLHRNKLKVHCHMGITTIITSQEVIVVDI